MTFEALVQQHGELRIYLETAGPIDLSQLQAALGYRFSSDRPHHTPSDPWEYAFADPGPIDSDAGFTRERDRIVAALTAQLPSGWQTEIMYYSAGQGARMWHWSSREGMIDLADSMTFA